MRFNKSKYDNAPRENGAQLCVLLKFKFIYFFKGPIVIVTKLCYWCPCKLHDRVQELKTGSKGNGPSSSL